MVMVPHDDNLPRAHFHVSTLSAIFYLSLNLDYHGAGSCLLILSYFLFSFKSVPNSLES